MRTYTIDAKGKKLGRIASQAAKLIIGKDSPDYKRNVISEVSVVIENASKADIGEKKLSFLNYQRYSGYPGGRKVVSAQQMIAKKGYAEIFRIAVFGMLPINRLRSRMIKHLIVNE